MKDLLFFIGATSLIVLLIWDPEWFTPFGKLIGILFVGWMAFLFVSLYVLTIFFKASEVKREKGWFYAIVTGIGLTVFFVFWFLYASSMDKRMLP